MAAMSDSQRSPQELDTLVEITEILTGRLPFREKCDSVLALFAKFTGSEFVTLRELDSESSTLDLIASYNDLVPDEEIRDSIPADLYLSAQSLKTKSPVALIDHSAESSPLLEYLPGVKSALSLPIQIDGEMFGVLVCASSSTGRYQEEDWGVLAAIGSVVGMMIAKAELEEDNAVEANIGRIVSSTLVGPDVFKRFSVEAAKLIDFDRLALNSVDLDEYTYVTEFLFGLELPDFPIGIAQKIDDTGLEVAVQTRTSQRLRFGELEGVETKFRLAGPFLAAGQPYLISVPLIVGDQIIGALGFNRGGRPFSQKELIKAERLGNLMAGAFADFKQQEYRARTEREITRNRAILEAEAAIGRILSAPLNTPGASELLISEIANIIPLDHVVVAGIDIETETFTQDFVEFLHDPGLMLMKNSGEPYAGSITSEVVSCGTGQIINSDDSRLVSGQLPRAKMMFDQGYRTMMATPLVFEEKIIGTLILLSRREREYSEGDLTFADRIGTLLAGSLARHKITAERDRAQSAQSKGEARHRAVLEAEASIGRILSSPSERTGASETLLSEIANVISLDRVVIVGVDTETETFSPDFVEFLHEPRLMVVDNYGKPYAGSITAEVVKYGTGQILDFDDSRLVSGKLPVAQEIFDLGFRTMMAVPIVFEETIIGSLILLSRREREYDEEDMAVADRIGHLLAGALATFKITAERDRARSDLSENYQRFRQIAESIGGVFWLVELEPRRLIYASENFEDVWDVPLDDVYDDFGDWFKRTYPEDIPKVENACIAAFQAGELDFEHRIIKRDGSMRWIHCRGFPVKNSNGKVYRMSGIAEDITDRKTELERIAEAGRLLSVGELASGVAHEINNPLAAIDLYSESLMGQGLPDSVVKDLKVISDQGKRAATIVRNLLQFARKSLPEIVAVDAREFIERCLALKTHDFRVNNISVSTNVFLDHPAVEIDEQLMTQVLVNILSNAEHACVTANGRGHISISVRETGGSIRISVSDDGPGIPAENLTKVFDPFFTTKEAGGGTGLGLSVSYGIIAQLGGTLWAESDEGTGSTFHIEVPSTTGDRSAEPPGDLGTAGPTEQAAISPLRLLVVDDEPDLRNIIVRLLERRNHKVDAAGDGDEAWDKLQDQSYDCIMLDLRMAGTGGQELFQRLSAVDSDMAGKIIFLTGDMANTSTRSFLDPLANLVLQKPVSIGDLEQAISSVTGNLQR